MTRSCRRSKCSEPHSGSVGGRTRRNYVEVLTSPAHRVHKVGDSLERDPAHAILPKEELGGELAQVHAWLASRVHLVILRELLRPDLADHA